MEGYRHTVGQEREYPELERIKAFNKSVLDIIKVDPVEEAERAKRNAENVAETMRKESIFWLKYIACVLGGISAYTVLFAIYG